MKREKHYLLAVILITLLFVGVIVVLILPNVFLLISYDHVPTNTNPLYNTSIVQLQDNDDLCIAMRIDGLTTLAPTLRIKFIVDGNVIPFSELYWDRKRLSNLTIEYESDVVCTSRVFLKGKHDLIVMLYNDLWNVKSTKIIFQAAGDGYKTLLG